MKQKNAKANVAGNYVNVRRGRLAADLDWPLVGGGCSQEDFKYFIRSWNQYVRASNEVDPVKLRDQLLHCPDEALKKAVDRALGDRVENITVVDFLKEIETLAVARQSNHVIGTDDS